MDNVTNEYNVRLVGGLTLLIVLFWGKPDIHDAIIFWLMNGG